MRAGERLRALGDVNGIWPLTHVGEHEGDVVAANILGDAEPMLSNENLEKAAAEGKQE